MKGTLRYLLQDWRANRPFAALFLVVFRLGQLVESAQGPLRTLGRPLYAAGNLVFGRVLGGGGQFDPSAEFGPRLRLPHGPVGIVVHGAVVAGADCVLMQNSTLGANPFSRRNYGAPTLGDKVFVGAGAAIVGRVSVGDGVVVGVNAAVSTDVPSNAVVKASVVTVRRQEPLAVNDQATLYDPKNLDLRVPY